MYKEIIKNFYKLLELISMVIDDLWIDEYGVNEQK